MKKAIRVCSILCIALLLVGIMSCSNGSEPDTWTRVTNLNELQGTWEGSTTYTEEYPIDEAGNTTNISMTVTMQVQYPVDGTNGKGLKLVSITDMTNVIDELVSLYGSQPSGGVSITADYLWEEIKNTTETEGITYSEGRPYTVTSEGFLSESDLSETLAINDDYLLINQSKNKLKLKMSGEKEIIIILQKK